MPLCVDETSAELRRIEQTGEGTITIVWHPNCEGLLLKESTELDEAAQSPYTVTGLPHGQHMFHLFGTVAAVWGNAVVSVGPWPPEDPTDPPVVTVEPPDAGASEGLTTGQVVGIAFGALFGLLLVAGGAVAFFRSRKYKGYGRLSSYIDPMPANVDSVPGGDYEAYSDLEDEPAAIVRE